MKPATTLMILFLGMAGCSGTPIQHEATAVVVEDNGAVATDLQGELEIGIVKVEVTGSFCDGTVNLSVRVGLLGVSVTVRLEWNTTTGAANLCGAFLVVPEVCIQI
jgi:hypothetical protein